MCRQRADKVQLFVFIFHGLVQVCDIEIPQMGKNNDNPYLVCENIVVVNAITKSDFQTDQWCKFLKYPYHAEPKISSFSYRVSYMSTRVLLNLLNMLGKNDKIIQEQKFKFYLLHDIKNYLKISFLI